MTKRFIIKGGLGNQLFQYSYYKYLIEHRENVKLDLGRFYLRSFRPLSLFDFKIKARIHPFFVSLYWRLFKIQYKDDIVGYFQSLEYPTQFRTELLEELNLKNSSRRLMKEISLITSSGESLAIHVRRGDYLNYSDMYEVCGLDYYMRAIDLIKKIKQIDAIFIFTDDVDWVRENFAHTSVKKVVSEMMFSDSEELTLMSSCSNFIISNSTFSWWGAWLCRSEGSIKVAPKKWLKSEEDNNKLVGDLVPEDWITI